MVQYTDKIIFHSDSNSCCMMIRVKVRGLDTDINTHTMTDRQATVAPVYLLTSPSQTSQRITFGRRYAPHIQTYPTFIEWVEVLHCAHLRASHRQLSLSHTHTHAQTQVFVRLLSGCCHVSEQFTRLGAMVALFCTKLANCGFSYEQQH